LPGEKEKVECLDGKSQSSATAAAALGVEGGRTADAGAATAAHAATAAWAALHADGWRRAGELAGEPARTDTYIHTCTHTHTYIYIYIYMYVYGDSLRRM
jgi:hypothetical protein